MCLFVHVCAKPALESPVCVSANGCPLLYTLESP